MKIKFQLGSFVRSFIWFSQKKFRRKNMCFSNFVELRYVHSSRSPSAAHALAKRQWDEKTEIYYYYYYASFFFLLLLQCSILINIPPFLSCFFAKASFFKVFTLNFKSKSESMLADWLAGWSYFSGRGTSQRFWHVDFFSSSFKFITIQH